ncbi:DUF2142 domain-containing protein [Methylobacterium sp. J-076]|uniref:DUF2142 domain-containing protein n=1 Tax=Methylobacterium sp. J-076 TaxID=2836655 RepID=UPI001FBB9875|nr:DUF2142 domain-containing protein [Methylobacterium sp. J-076]MCJ2012582.1 DUF2142 domain-containing protein [Methylobacterium sp. J-076]
MIRLPSGPRFWCLAYLCLCAPVCIALALIVPPGEVADEAAHLARAAALMQGDVVGHRESVRYADGSTHVAAGVRLDPVWARAALSRPKDFGGSLAAEDGAPDARGRVFVPLYTVGTYPPFLYAPAAAGLASGRLLGLAPEVCLYLGRLANATATIALSLAALALATRGRVALFALLALPMTLSLAASFNQDAPIIALSALAAALLTPRPLAGPGARLRLIGAILSLALVVLAKPPYAGLAAMLLVPFPRAGDGDGGGGLARHAARRLAAAALAVLPAALWTAAATATVATPVPRNAYEAGPLWSGPRPATFAATDPKAQGQVLLDRPARLLTLPGHYLGTIKHLTMLAKGAIGIFGWLDRPLPAVVYGTWALALLAPLVLLRGGVPPPWPERLILPAAALACLWLVLLSQYLTWTNVGESRIDGPQGRYLLPLVPMLVLAFARARPGAAPAGRWPAMLPVAAAAIDLAALPLAALAAAVPA